MRRSFHEASAPKLVSLVVRVGSATQAEAEEGAAAEEHEQTHEDIDQGGGPESKQVQGLVAIGVQICRDLVVVGLVNGVDPHIAWMKKETFQFQQLVRSDGAPPQGRGATSESVKKAVLTGNKPAAEEEGSQRVPEGADWSERVGRLVFTLTGTWQEGEQHQHHFKDSRHDQIDGDVRLPRTVVQVYCTCWTNRNVSVEPRQQDRNDTNVLICIRHSPIAI